MFFSRVVQGFWYKAPHGGFPAFRDQICSKLNNVATLGSKVIAHELFPKFWNLNRAKGYKGIGEISSLGTWRFIRSFPLIRNQTEDSKVLDSIIEKELRKRVAELRG